MFHVKHLNAVLIVLALIVGVLISEYVFPGRNHKDFEKKQYFDSVFHELQRAHKVDSIKSAHDKIYIDSIVMILNRVDDGISRTGVEIKRLRKRNEDALNNLDKLMHDSRPDF